MIVVITTVCCLDKLNTEIPIYIIQVLHLHVQLNF